MFGFFSPSSLSSERVYCMCLWFRRTLNVTMHLRDIIICASFGGWIAVEEGMFRHLAASRLNSYLVYQYGEQHILYF